MLSKKDLQLIGELFDTKFDSQFSIAVTCLDQKFEEKFGAFTKEVRNVVLQYKDDIMFEIKNMREQLAIVVGYRDLISNHEKRITGLEIAHPSKSDFVII